ncbi:MAG: hypothetical protein Q9211_003447 [Gyalolechia sp. 1 TL-2023]
MASQPESQPSAPFATGTVNSVNKGAPVQRVGPDVLSFSQESVPCSLKEENQPHTLLRRTTPSGSYLRGRVRMASHRTRRQTGPEVLQLSHNNPDPDARFLMFSPPTSNEVHPPSSEEGKQLELRYVIFKQVQQSNLRDFFAIHYRLGLRIHDDERL